MKAIVHEEYGPPDRVLGLGDIDAPVPKDDEVLVRVRAAAVNWADWASTRGLPYLMRMVYGLRRPRNGVRGTDVAGTVEAVGRDVQRLQPGDEVFGWCTAALAEYARTEEEHLVPKPASLTFAEAAAVPMAGFCALQALRDVGKVRLGQHVLVNGASGGIGTFAVQIAKAFGAEVTSVCSTGNLNLVRSLGADHVIDYTREDFTRGQQRYDLILDIADDRSLSERRRVLTSTGPSSRTTGWAVRGSGAWVESSGRACCRRSCATGCARSSRCRSARTWSRSRSRSKPGRSGRSSTARIR